MDTTPSHPVRTDLVSSPFGDLSAGANIDLKAYVSEVPAGCDSGRHRHPYPTVVFVLEGLFRFEEGEQGETVTEYKAGEVFSEKAGVVVRGVALEPTRLLVVVPKESGKPESVML